jgi:TRAP-type C4-dicarboxylate transport system permease small subunit
MDVPISSPPPPPPAVPASSTTSRAVLALVFGILGVICCGFFAPVAWYLGKEELAAIDAGRLPDSNRGMAQIAMILGIIGTILLALGVIYLVFFGGLAALSALGEISRGL